MESGRSCLVSTALTRVWSEALTRVYGWSRAFTGVASKYYDNAARRAVCLTTPPCHSGLAIVIDILLIERPRKVLLIMMMIMIIFNTKFTLYYTVILYCNIKVKHMLVSD
jgi:hypothetical protein